jgi:hypothetical protein
MQRIVNSFFCALRLCLPFSELSLAAAAAVDGCAQEKGKRERESTDRERENNSGEELGLSFDRRLCFFPLSQPRPQSKHPQNSFTVVAPPPRDAQLGQVRP